MSIQHTKEQRLRLFALARLLDKVPAKHFDMSEWFSMDGNRAVCERGFISKLKTKACGFAGCAMGWAMTSNYIRAGGTLPVRVLGSLGFDTERLSCDSAGAGDPGTALFGPVRNVGPKQVAKDIRRYLKDGKLPPIAYS